MLTRCLLALLLLASPALADPSLDSVLPRWRALVQAAMEKTGVPGCSVAVVSRGRVVMLEGFGVTDVDHPAPVTPDTVFRLASCSKPVATTAVAALVSEGKLSFDTPIRELMPDFALADPWVSEHVTVRDLCSHRSGLPGQAGNELEELGWDQAHILRALRFVPLGNRFRADYSYSNFGITAGVEAACGGRFPQVLQEKVLGPLGMSSSSARYEDFARAPEVAREHILEQGRAVRRFDRMPDAQAPAGGVYSTARDLTRFLLLHLGEGQVDGRQIVAAEALSQTHLPLMPTGFNPATFSSGFYAMGWAVAYDRYGQTEIKHSGAFSTGTRSQLFMLPEEELGVAILCNAFPSGLPEALSQALVDLLHGQEVGLDDVLAFEGTVAGAMAGLAGGEPDAPARGPVVPPPFPLERYAGRYGNDYFGPARIEGMRLTLGPGGRVSGVLKPFDGNTFTYEVELSDGPLTTLVRFDDDLGGFTMLDDFGTGYFRRQ